MTMPPPNLDARAAHAYWDGLWKSQPLPPLRHPEHDSLRNHGQAELHRFISRGIGAAPGGADPRRILEFGCAQSLWLPYFARVHGLAVAGIDYSAEGCARAEGVLAREGLGGTIVCSDFTTPPPEFLGAFDLAFSYGVVEHFEDTAAGLAALVPYLKPGGRMITLVPNMRGLPGALQKAFGREIYDIHVPLSAEDLAAAHRAAGLEVVEAAWLVPMNFGVLNLKGAGPNILRRALVAASFGTWMIDRALGRRLPRTRALSAYAGCIARRPG